MLLLVIFYLCYCFKKLSSLSELLCAMKGVCRVLWAEDVSFVDDLRLAVTLRMMRCPHFNAKMNALKEVGGLLRAASFMACMVRSFSHLHSSCDNAKTLVVRYLKSFFSCLPFLNYFCFKPFRSLLFRIQLNVLVFIKLFKDPCFLILIHCYG